MAIPGNTIGRGRGEKIRSWTEERSTPFRRTDYLPLRLMDKIEMDLLAQIDNLRIAITHHHTQAYLLTKELREVRKQRRQLLRSKPECLSRKQTSRKV